MVILMTSMMTVLRSEKVFNGLQNATTCTASQLLFDDILHQDTFPPRAGHTGTRDVHSLQYRGGCFPVVQTSITGLLDRPMLVNATKV